jgi:molybdate transport system substrate-binding protein
MSRCFHFLKILVLVIMPGAARAAEAQVAVAANFAAPAKRLAQEFGKLSRHRVELSSGSTGKFYAQVKNGAPFDAFLSADAETPLTMEREKLAVAGSRFTYAAGRLALWSRKPGFVDSEAAVLRRPDLGRLAIASPRLAPYGAAAKSALEKLGLWQTLQGRLVQGENIAQTYQFVSTGNAELGFVALSQVRETQLMAGSYWLVPGELHAPLRQDAVLLTRGADNAAARDFLAFLRSAEAREMIRAYGYELPAP